MRGAEFNELHSFLEIAERRSFVRAAAHLGVTPSALSQTLKKLEARLGVVLVNRTTRSVSLTEAGARLSEDVRGAVDTITRATESLEAYRDGSRGHVRITASRVAIEVFLGPRIATLRRRFPHVTLEVDANNRFVDLAEDRMDLGLRRGEFLPANAVGKRLTADERFVAVAAPSYLARAGEPRAPSELGDHECIRLRSLRSGKLSPWRFTDGSREFEQRVSGGLVVSDARVALNAAVAGLGIALLAETFVAPSVASGELSIVLAGSAPRRSGLFLYHAGTQEPRGAAGAVFSFLASEAET